MRTKRKIINLFEDKNIFSIKYVVSIDKEEDLNQFWDFLTSSENSSHNIINTFITEFYNFALSYINSKDAQFFEIILEENDESFYFTLWNKKIALLFQEYIKNTSLESKYDRDRISVKLKKKKFKDKLQKINANNEQREKNLITSVTKENTPKRVEPYTFLEDDDLQELLKLSDDLEDLMYQINKVGLNENLFISFRSKLSLFCLTLRYYDEISQISVTITNFSNLLNTNKEKFMNLEKEELDLIIGFVNNIEKWIRTLFVTGGADIHFMDNSMKADYNTIAQMTDPSKESVNEFDLDDIFMF
jgi:hypothetical protein